MSFAEQLIEAMEPWNTGPVINGSTDAERFQRARAAPFEPVTILASEVGSDGEPGYLPAWGVLLAVELCPGYALPWLAQFVGVTIPQGATEAEARALIRAKAGFARGTLGAIKAELIRTLPEGARFIILERTAISGAEDAYQMVIGITGIAGGGTWETATGEWKTGHGTWFSEGPVASSMEAVERVKPVIRINWLVSAGQTWFNDTGPWETSTRTWAGSLLPGE